MSDCIWCRETIQPTAKICSKCNLWQYRTFECAQLALKAAAVLALIATAGAFVWDNIRYPVLSLVYSPQPEVLFHHSDGQIILRNGGLTPIFASHMESRLDDPAAIRVTPIGKVMLPGEVVDLDGRSSDTRLRQEGLLAGQRHFGFNATDADFAAAATGDISPFIMFVGDTDPVYLSIMTAKPNLPAGATQLQSPSPKKAACDLLYSGYGATQLIRKPVACVATVARYGS